MLRPLIGKLALPLVALLVLTPSLAAAQEAGGALSAPSVGSTSGRPVPAAPLAPVPPPPLGYGAPPSPRIGTHIDVATVNLLRVLGQDLRAVGAVGNHRVRDGSLGILGGAIGIAIGVLSRHDGSSMSSYFYLWGASGVAGGIFVLALTPDVERPLLDFVHMPMRNQAEADARLAFGEASLAHLAKRSRVLRLLDGSMNIATGVLAVPILLAHPSFSRDDVYFYFAIAGSAIATITGVLSLIRKSTAEKRWSAYERLRERFRTEHALQWELDATALPGGAAGQLRLSF